jgi:hypothetical protein
MEMFGYTRNRRSAFWQFVYQYGVPHIKLGPRRIMFDEGQVRAWLAARSTTGKVST